jgi:hypothetical protein
MKSQSAKKWAQEQFGATQLGDVRRTRRLVEMATSAALRPSGKVAVVFDRPRDREGAYDFLESPQVDVAAVAESLFAATAERARSQEERLVYVALDPSSLTLPDEEQVRGFGPIGSPNRPARGLMVMNALAVDLDGVPLGLIDQRFWAQKPPSRGTVAERTKRNLLRPFEDKRGAFFVRSAEATIERLRPAKVVPWFVIDREADSRNILEALTEMPCVFTIRGTKNRVLTSREEESHVREALRAERVLATDTVKVGRNDERAARTATVEIRAKEVELRFHGKPMAPTGRMKITAVLVREVGLATNAKGALDWLLYTNAPVATAERALRVVHSYRARWRVEEFHRTWKQGACNVESALLRSFEAVAKWATILAAVAARIERLKYLSRNTPDAPASVEFEPIQLEALKAAYLGLHRGKRMRLPDMPSIHDVTRIAELGGYMALKSSGPPGSITIARGLEKLSIYVQALVDLRRMQGTTPKGA